MYKGTNLSCQSSGKGSRPKPFLRWSCNIYLSQAYGSSSRIYHCPFSRPQLTHARLIYNVQAGILASTPCITVTSTSLPDDCRHCIQPQIRQLKTHTISCGCPATLPTTVVSSPCPSQCTPTGLISWTSTSLSCEATGAEFPNQPQQGTLTVDVSQLTMDSKVKCVTITKTDGPSCTVTPSLACPTQSSCTSLNTVKVTNYCGCDGIKETTICRTTCE